jgi:hypothetical protein
MTTVFTDIDGVLFNTTSNRWNKTAINLYNKLCLEFNLKAVISSTWRTNHSIYQLQNIFLQNGIEVEIYDYTPIISFDGRGSEIGEWLRNNEVDNFIILDDCTRDIERQGLANIVKCRGWIGFSKEEYDIARKIILKDKYV